MLLLHERLTGDHHVVADAQVRRATADHAADHAALADGGAAGDTGAAGDGGVIADAHVVADLDLVIQS